MRSLALRVGRMFALLLMGGLLGAVLVRSAPGFGTDERQLDSRLNHVSMQALRSSADNSQSLSSYYTHYLNGLMHGDLGYSKTLDAPVGQLLAERLPETIRSVAYGLLLAWILGLGLAVASVMSRRWAVDVITSLGAGVLLCLPAAMLGLLFMLAHAPGRLVIGLIVFPQVFHYTRSLLEQSASRPHVLHAWAKGLTGMRVLTGHMMMPIAPQLLALVGISISIALAAATRLVFSDGNPAAPIMLVGEAPGADEDRSGVPFVGRGGQLLDRMLGAIGLDRTGVYIANVVPWRPPGNRDPTPQEVATCLPFIQRQIALCDPDILLLMGKAALQALTTSRDGITRARGRWLEFDTGARTIRALPMLHPAYLLRQASQKKLAWRDWRTLQKALAER